MTSHDMPSFLDERGHVPATEMARYLDGTSDRVARSQLTHHLAGCDECREELTALRRLVPPRSRLTTRVGAVIGAAAAVVLITMSWRGSLTSSIDQAAPDSTRALGGVVEIDAPIPVVSPTSDSVISASNLRLTWHAAGADASYRLVVLDESGGTVFAEVTGDTSTIGPAAVIAKRSRGSGEQAAHTYFWSVEASLLDGRSAKTGLHRLRVR